MDSFYPTKAAVQALTEWSEKMCKEDAPLIKMGMAWPAMALNIDKVTIKELDGGRTAKAMFPTDGPHRQEAVFTVVGVLKAKDLPPVKGSRQVFRFFINTTTLTQQRRSLKADRLQYARQHATLAGWDAPSFKKALENMQEVAYTMYSAFSEDAIDPWRPEASDPHNAEISSNCRYFTVGRNIPVDSRTKFHPRTDPHGVLTRFLSDGVAHCFDNDVMYMAFKGDEYVEKDPGTFKTGDIVEMGFAFVAWKKPGKNVGPDWSCMLVLRTLTFLDGQFTKEAYFAREAHRAERSMARATEDRGQADNHIPKRRITATPDSDDEYSTTTSKRMHMLTIVDATATSSESST
ncbi:hypothetical protein B0H14DRAFT_3501632 [Mycena olivaceomarginata]|nr:hypothetical protein B0H14DRAFT_3501632 [Mycena olivaceomarginata]